MTRLYANENFPLQVVQFLRAYNHDVLTVVEAGKASQAIPDEDVLAHAISESRAVLTLNRRDFIRLHQRQPDYDGIIVCTIDPDIQRQATRIHDAIIENEPLQGKLIRVNRPPG